MGKYFRLPPFKVDRTLHISLAVQLSDALRTAIRTGYYAPGDLLPPIRELSEMTGISTVLVSKAIKILKEERLINPRPHNGIEVCAADRPMWKGQVLIVVPFGGSIQYLTVVGDVLRDSLTSKGYLPLIATVPHKADGTYDFSFLELMLHHQIDAVVQLHDQIEISQWLSGKGIPFIRFSKTRMDFGKNCLCTVLRKNGAMIGEFAKYCREKSVKKVLQVSMDSIYSVDVRESLGKVGVAVEEWKVVMRNGRHIPGTQVARASADAFTSRLEKEGRKWLPDVLFFQDDYLAMGALTALQAAGVRIPEDVGVVTW
ncbi:MAG: GntR family transcriptional regulator, partial [Kiritimatiellae bacterium]|nr:GntR family transcriptional regulator [Kiritimatiellia bacterium]